MISGENILLQEINETYTPLILKWRNSESVMRNFIIQEPLTEEMHNMWLKNKVATGEVAQFIILIKDGLVPIGTVYLRDIDKVHDKAEFGIYIGENFQRGKGYGKESTQLICQYGFEVLNLHKIMLRVLAFNESAIKTYEHAGFKQEAYLKQDVKINDKYEDVILMALFCE